MPIHASFPAGGGKPVEQATPTISVSDGGLITATAQQNKGYVQAGVKTATHQMSPVSGAQIITHSVNQSNGEVTAVASQSESGFTNAGQTDSDVLQLPTRSGESTYLYYEGDSVYIPAGTYLTGAFYVTATGYSTCLIEGTPINMADGTEKAIEDLKPGELVQSYNPETKELVPAVVIRSYKTGSERSFTAYTFSNGSHLTVYGMHGFYNAESGTTKNLEEISRNDSLVTIDGGTAKWSRSSKVYLCGERHDRYNLITSNNLYFADGVLLGQKPFNKYQFFCDRKLPIAEDIAAIWKQDCDDYNSYSEFLIQDDYFDEIAAASEQIASTRRIIEENKRLLSESDYKSQKRFEGVLSDYEWQEAIQQRAGWRKIINDTEPLLANAQAEFSRILSKHRSADADWGRKIFNACCARDNAIFERVKEYFTDGGKAE